MNEQKDKWYKGLPYSSLPPLNSFSDSDYLTRCMITQSAKPEIEPEVKNPSAKEILESIKELKIKFNSDNQPVVRIFYLICPFDEPEDLDCAKYERISSKLRELFGNLPWYICNPAQETIIKNMTKKEFIGLNFVGMKENCNSAILMPGWEKSTSAIFEYIIAKDLGFDIFEIDNF